MSAMMPSQNLFLCHWLRGVLQLAATSCAGGGGGLQEVATITSILRMTVAEKGTTKGQPMQDVGR